MPEHPDSFARMLEGMNRRERAEVEDVAAFLALAGPPATPPAGLEERTLAAVRAAANGRAPALNGADSQEEAPNGVARPGRPPAAVRPAEGPVPGRAPVSPGAGRTRGEGHGRRVRPRRERRGFSWLRSPRPVLAGGLALAVALVVGALAGVALERGSGPAGQLELEATLRGPDGTAAATVRETGIGRVIHFSTGALPILPKGEYYELWFVGPGDRPDRPNRISAGTFHPDPEGRSDVRFTAAVDPAKYPRLAVTAEPGDGDPAPTGPDLMRSPGQR